MFRSCGIFLSLLLLCSCATENRHRSGLPADVTMNEAAGRGGMLFVTIRLADGEKLPFVVDTGASATVFDQSLAPKLGKSTVPGTFHIFGVKHEVGIYKAPRLCLGSTPLLMTGDSVVTLDCQHISSDGERPQMGILGMDVLGHYCLQLDFTARKIRFLDDQHADKTGWGKPFPLTDLGDGCFAVNENLTGQQGAGSLIDTGCGYDGWLQPELFQQWTNHAPSSADHKGRLPDGALGGEAYPGLDLSGLDPQLLLDGDGHLKFNGIGLHTLSRNLVTLDFPARTMYLKRTSIGPLTGKDMQATAKSEGKSALKFLNKLNRQNRLPGWAKGAEPAAKTVHYFFSYPDFITFDQVQKKGGSSVYHYQVSRPGKSKPWQLKKAWRTDQAGHTLEEYPLP